MALAWIRESPPEWDAGKRRIVGGAPRGIFDTRFAKLVEGELVPGEWWRVESDGRAVGYGWLDAVWGDAEILLAVDPEVRGSGVGTFIVDHLEAEAKDRATFAEQMIGIVSHDLRNPVAGIQMGAALLARGNLSESQQRTLSRITRAAERANHLIADLLDFTQARLGKGLQVSRAAIDLHDCVSGVVEDLALTYPGVLKHERVGPGAPALGRASRVIATPGIQTERSGRKGVGRLPSGFIGVGDELGLILAKRQSALPPE